MKIVDLANELYIEIGSPTSTSIAAIAFWLRGQIGRINNLLFEDFVLDGDYEIVDGNGDEISENAAAILKAMYRVYDFNLQIRSNMTAISSDSVLRVEDNGSSVTKINKNEVSKTLASLKEVEERALKDLITAYRLKLASPSQVVGDDTVVGVFNADLTSASLSSRY
jgi:hypothetical protein